MAQEAGSAVQDSVLAYHPQSEKLVLVESAKQHLQMDGIEGLAEVSLERINKLGGYVTERYKHLKHFHDLLREEDFSLFKVVSSEASWSWAMSGPRSWAPGPSGSWAYSLPPRSSSRSRG